MKEITSLITDRAHLSQDSPRQPQAGAYLPSLVPTAKPRLSVDHRGLLEIRHSSGTGQDHLPRSPEVWLCGERIAPARWGQHISSLGIAVVKEFSC